MKTWGEERTHVGDLSRQILNERHQKYQLKAALWQWVEIWSCQVLMAKFQKCNGANVFFGGQNLFFLSKNLDQCFRQHHMCLTMFLPLELFLHQTPAKSAQIALIFARKFWDFSGHRPDKNWQNGFPVGNVEFFDPNTSDKTCKGGIPSPYFGSTNHELSQLLFEDANRLFSHKLN